MNRYEPKKHVLVVDDEVEMREMLGDIIQTLGVTVSLAESGSDALLKIGKQIPNVIVSDLRMDRGSGTDLLRSLRKFNLNIPFILMTGIRELTEDSLSDDGIKHILYKPFKPQELLSAVQAQLKETNKD